MAKRTIRCKACGIEHDNYYRHRKVCKGNKEPQHLHDTIKSPAGVSSPPPPESTPPAQTTETLSDIERELNSDITPLPPVAGSESAPPITTAETVNAANIIYIRYAFKFVNSFLNKQFNTNDWDMTDEELKKLEDATIATLNYYRVQVTPPVVLLIVVFCAYVLPLLKHLGLLDKIKNRIKKLKDKENKEDNNAA